ncbi:MAG TPA: DUF72 domain-containing protein [Gemmatimonadales bacterium]|nr:DUF72 domain-containing protein [Gemmatimonadales bacterium]
MSASVRLGTQGWNFPAWVGEFYPLGTRRAEWLRIYARAFPTVEVDSTFYATPAEPVVRAWRDQAPAGFQFSLKIPQAITHERKLKDCGDLVARFCRRALTLGDALGPLLVQMSPEFRAAEATYGLLEAFLASLPGEIKWAVEFRHPGWLTQRTLDLLSARRVALVLADSRWIRRELILDLALEPTADFGYVRWVGVHRLNADPAQAGDRDREIALWARALEGLARRVSVVLGYFNNHYQGHAPRSVRTLQRQLGQEPVSPAALQEQAELF